MNRYKIAGYITAFKDTDALKNCIEAIKKQSYPVEIIYIIDNSPQPIINKNNREIVTYHEPSNLGVAGGLARILEKALRENYDFLWTFDQDSIPDSKALEYLISFYQKKIKKFKLV